MFTVKSRRIWNRILIASLMLSFLAGATLALPGPISEAFASGNNALRSAPLAAPPTPTLGPTPKQSGTHTPTPKPTQPGFPTSSFPSLTPWPTVTASATVFVWDITPIVLTSPAVGEDVNFDTVFIFTDTGGSGAFFNNIHFINFGTSGLNIPIRYTLNSDGTELIVQTDFTFGDADLEGWYTFTFASPHADFATLSFELIRDLCHPEPPCDPAYYRGR
jgi:hypothetical protein